MNRLFAGRLALAFLLGCAPALPQVLPGANGILTGIKATGSKRFTDEQVIAASGLHLGEKVTREDFQAAANRLAQLGLFANVQYRFMSEGPNVTLEFTVADAPTFPVAFDNFPWFTDEEITQALRANLPLYDGTAPQSGSYLDVMNHALNRLLETRRVQGVVRHDFVQDPLGNGMIQQFRVLGSSLPIATVEFTDPLANKDPHVRDRLGDLIGKPFSRFIVEMFVFEQVRPLYLEHGYLRVHFEQPQARFFGNPNAPLPNQVMVVVPVGPGPIYRWAGATWTGNSAFDAMALDRIVGLHSGQVANGTAIAAAWHRLREKYGSQGYLDVQLEPRPSYDDADTLIRYHVTLHEGEQYRMGQLVVTGLSLEAEHRLRQAWQIHPGQIFDKAYFGEFLRSIVKEAFVGLPVHYDRIGHWLQRNPETKTVDLLLDFE